MLIPLDAPPKACVCGSSLVGIAGLSTARGMHFFSECCVLSGSVLCVGLITPQEVSYRVWCV